MSCFEKNAHRILPHLCVTDFLIICMKHTQKKKLIFETTHVLITVNNLFSGKCNDKTNNLDIETT